MNKIVIGIVLLIFGIVGFLSFTKGSSDSNDGKGGYEILSRWDLPNELNEISGIAWIGANRIACVQDEDGIIFIYNLATSKVENSITFGEGGDYEGITVMGESAYVLRSDGVIFEISQFESEEIKVTEHKTLLQDLKSINVEGLCKDSANNRLLLAVKERKGLKDHNEIYAFDLDNKNIGSDPSQIIDFSDPVFKELKGKSKGKFSPGDIAIHPKTGEIYLLDGTNPKILITTENGLPKEIIMLQSKDFGNPEGITFSKEGDMYISNEAEGNSANILKVSVTK